MWQRVLIVLLVGLLIGSTAANIALLRQASTAAQELARQRSRGAAADATQAALQSQLEDLQTATPSPPPDANYLGGGPAAASSQIEQIGRAVEAIRGLSRTRNVPVQFQDSAILSQTVKRNHSPDEFQTDQKLLVALGALRPDQSLYDSLEALETNQVLAAYSPSDKMLYVAANPVEPLRPEVQAAVAREFVHALQDQTFDLSQLQPKHPASEDQSAALHAVLEGDAGLVQRVWMQQNLSQTTLDNLPDPETESFDQAPAIVQADWRFTRLAGLQFAQTLYQHSGSFDGINAAYTKAPPLSTAQILEPQKYFSHLAPVDVTLPDLAAGLGTGWRRIDGNVLGQFHLFNVVTEGSDSETAARAAAGWTGDRWQLLEDNNGHTGVVLRTAWDSEDAAQTFFTTYAAALKVRFACARSDVDGPMRLALTDTMAGVELRLSGTEVLAVIAFDRLSAEALVSAVGGF